MNEPRVYRHSPFMLVLIVLIFGLLAVGMFVTLGQDDYYFLLPFGGIFVVILLISLYSITLKTIISDTEISTQSILSTKTLNWSEINRVSGRGNGIKLHNFDGNITVTPSPQLPGYEEVIEWIGIKRPDLFNPQEHSEMKRNWVNNILLLFVVLLLFAGFSGLTIFNSEPSEAWIPLVFFFIIGMVVLVATLSSPQSVTMDGRSLLLKYVFNQSSLPADEIQSVELRNQRTRNGRVYFIVLNLTNGKSIRLSALNPSLPIAFLTLKNWHNKNAGNSLTNYPRI